MKINEQSLRIIWNTIECINIQHTSRGRGGGRSRNKIFEETMAENFSNLLKNINVCILEPQRTPRRINS